jgi:hypothetical protein
MRGGTFIQASFRSQNLAFEGFFEGCETILKGFTLERQSSLGEQCSHD